jgi:hypothetical protein
MLPTEQLLATLNSYEQLYTAPSATNRTLLLASKASILEVCGWVEQAMDQMIHDCAHRCNLSATRLSTVSTYVKNTYGFKYDQHFERMLSAVIGFRELERVESTIQTQLAPSKAHCPT